MIKAISKYNSISEKRYKHREQNSYYFTKEVYATQILDEWM